MNYKKIIALTVAVLLIGVVAVIAEMPGRTKGHAAGDVMGMGRLDSEPHRTFRLVRFIPQQNDTQVMSADSIVVWLNNDISGDDGVTVSTTDVSFDSKVAGVIVQKALSRDKAQDTAYNDLAGQNWTWLQTYGKSEVWMTSAAGGSAGSGDALATSATQGGATYFRPYMSFETDASIHQGNAGFFYEDGALNGANVEVFLKCE